MAELSEKLKALGDDRQALMAAALTTPLAEINPSWARLFSANAILPWFKRLRDEAPVHYCADSAFGGFWSITRYADIEEIERDTQTFSSEPTIVIGDQAEDFQLPMFIAMDPPKHDIQRRTVQGAVSRDNLDKLAPLIRERVVAILDGLPEGETFNWVERVSIELTTQMLATLFDFPFEDRKKLTFWSDIALASPALVGAMGMSEEVRRGHLHECLSYFTELWNQRVNAAPGNDLISMLSQGEHTRNMSSNEYLGNIILLIVGGNDTTRNSISSGVHALHQFPEQNTKLRADPSIIPNMVDEIIRWQTPLAHMRRTATRDVEFRGQQIKAGEKVVLWYLSANRDERVIKDPDTFQVDRPYARKHLAFGHGIHRCMGSRLAQLQLTIAWEEILKRIASIEVIGEPERTYSNFVNGYTQLMVRITR